MSAPLRRLRIMIWIQSAIGASLFIAFFWVHSATRDDAVIIGIFFLAILWLLGFAPVRRKAEALEPQDRDQPEALPTRVLSAWMVGEFVSAMIPGPDDWHIMVLIAHVWAGTALFLKGWVTCRLEIPMHRPTWLRGLAILAFGILWKLVCAVVAWGWH